MPSPDSYLMLASTRFSTMKNPAASCAYVTFIDGGTVRLSVYELPRMQMVEPGPVLATVPTDTYLVGEGREYLSYTEASKARQEDFIAWIRDQWEGEGDAGFGLEVDAAYWPLVTLEYVPIEP